MKNKIIQYLPLTRPLASYALTRKLVNLGINVILDLEDSAQDIFDDKKNIQLKMLARNGLNEISKFKIHNKNSRIYVRINSPETEFYKEDILTIKTSLINKFPIDGIFLPMVDSYDVILSLYNELDNKLEIVPMIETSSGMKNIEQILKQDVNEIIERVHYGNFDYSYSLGLWPFLDPNHDIYWDLISNMLRILKKYNKSFVSSPFPFPHNEKLFWECATYLEEKSELNEVWHCCVNSTLATSKKPNSIKKLEILKYNFKVEQKIEIAKKIIFDFIEGRSNKRSFGVSEHRFIAHHQYIAAKTFLKKNE